MALARLGVLGDSEWDVEDCFARLTGADNEVETSRIERTRCATYATDNCRVWCGKRDVAEDATTLDLEVLTHMQQPVNLSVDNDFGAANLGACCAILLRLAPLTIAIARFHLCQSLELEWSERKLGCATALVDYNLILRGGDGDVTCGDGVTLCPHLNLGIFDALCSENDITKRWHLCLKLNGITLACAITTTIQHFAACIVVDCVWEVALDGDGALCGVLHRKSHKVGIVTLQLDILGNLVHSVVNERLREERTILQRGGALATLLVEWIPTLRVAIYCPKEQMFRARECGNLAVAREELWLNLGVEVSTLDVPREWVVNGCHVTLRNLLIHVPTLGVTQQSAEDVGTAEILHRLIGIVLNDDVERVGSPTRVCSVCEVFSLGRVVDVALLCKTELLDILLYCNPHNLSVLALCIECCNLCVSATELLRNLIVLLDGYKAVFRSNSHLLERARTGDRHADRRATIHTRKTERSPRLVVGDDRGPRHIRVAQNPRQLWVVGTFLEVESVGLFAEKILNHTGAEQGATVVCFTIHIYVHRFRVECTRKVQLTALVDAHCVVENVRCRLLQRAESLSRKLELSLEVGMLIHKGEEVIINHRKIAPQCCDDIAVVVHISVKYETHINPLFCGFFGWLLSCPCRTED